MMNCTGEARQRIRRNAAAKATVWSAVCASLPDVLRNARETGPAKISKIKILPAANPSPMYRVLRMTSCILSWFWDA